MCLTAWSDCVLIPDAESNALRPRRTKAVLFGGRDSRPVGQGTCITLRVGAKSAANGTLRREQ